MYIFKEKAYNSNMVTHLHKNIHYLVFKIQLNHYNTKFSYVSVYLDYVHALEVFNFIVNILKFIYVLYIANHMKMVLFYKVTKNKTKILIIK